MSNTNEARLSEVSEESKEQLIDEYASAASEVHRILEQKNFPIEQQASILFSMALTLHKHSGTSSKEMQLILALMGRCYSILLKEEAGE
jgi:hypothetical protein